MLIFIQPLIVFFIISFPSAYVMGYSCSLLRADFNMGETVYETNIELNELPGPVDRMFQITSGNDSKTFRIFDFRTMIGTMVEFETFSPDPSVRCSFGRLVAAQGLYHSLNINTRRTSPEVRFPMISTDIVRIKNKDGNLVEAISNIITRGKLVIELNNRFHIIPEGYQHPDMIFSCKNFNVSPPLRYGRMILIIRFYDINVREIIPMKFILSFRNDEVAQSFYHYISQITDCVNRSIPLDLRDNLSP